MCIKFSHCRVLTDGRDQKRVTSWVCSSGERLREQVVIVSWDELETPQNCWDEHLAPRLCNGTGAQGCYGLRPWQTLDWGLWVVQAWTHYLRVSQPLEGYRCSRFSADTCTVDSLLSGFQCLSWAALGCWPFPTPGRASRVRVEWGIHEHWGLHNRWCEPDSLWMSLGWGDCSPQTPGVSLLRTLLPVP